MGRKKESVPLWRKVDKRYLLEKGRYIDPGAVRPSSNVRSVRESGVRLLYDILREQGWSNEKGLRVKEIPVGPDGKQYYGCIDGMHRITAVQRLREEEEQALLKVAKNKRESMRYWTRLEVLACVYSKKLPRSVEIQLAVEANWATSVMVKTTMFDMLSAMAEIRRGLLVEHNEKVQKLIDEGAGDGDEDKQAERDAEEEEEDQEEEDQEEEELGKKRGRRGKRRERKRRKVSESGKKRKAGKSKKKLGSLSVGLLKAPSDVPKEWVSEAYYRGGIGSYAQATVGTFSSLLYRFDNCPRSWAELESICNSPETELAVNNSNLYTTEFSQELSDGIKFWILRRLCGEFKASHKGLSKVKSRSMMSRQICVLREVEKLASIFKTNLLDFQWGSDELEKILREGLENGAFDKEIPHSASERKKLNNNPGTLLSAFDILVENYHEAGRDALDGFHRENLEEEGELGEEGEEGEEGEVEKEVGRAGQEEGVEGKRGAEESEQGGEALGVTRRLRSTPSPPDTGGGKEVLKWVSKGGTLRLFGQSFETFLKSDEFERIKGQARLVLTDPPYNLYKGVDHDRITEEQMKLFANGAFDILCRGGCLLVFCTWQQLAPWYKILKEAGFLLCPTPMHVVMMRNVNKKSNFLQNIVEYCIYAIAKVGKPGDSDVWLRWNGSSYINCKEPFPANTNCIVHFPSGEERKLLMKKEVNEEGKEVETPWRPQEKPLNLIRELVKRFSPPNSLIVDLFAGTFTTAMAARMQGQKFVGCEIDEDVFKAAIGRLEEFCKNEELNTGSDDPQISK